MAARAPSAAVPARGAMLAAPAGAVATMPPRTGSTGTPATFGLNWSVARCADFIDVWPVSESAAFDTVPNSGLPDMNETI